MRTRFARFASQSRPYAPLYRLITLAGLRAALKGGKHSVDYAMPCDDVHQFRPGMIAPTALPPSRTVPTAASAANPTAPAPTLTAVLATLTTALPTATTAQPERLKLNGTSSNAQRVRRFMVYPFLQIA